MLAYIHQNTHMMGRDSPFVLRSELWKVLDLANLPAARAARLIGKNDRDFQRWASRNADPLETIGLRQSELQYLEYKSK